MKKLLLLPLLFMLSCNSDDNRPQYEVYNMHTSQKVIWSPMHGDESINYTKGDTVIKYESFLVNGENNSREDKCIIISKIN